MRRVYHNYQGDRKGDFLFGFALLCFVAAAVCWLVCPFSVRLFIVVPLTGLGVLLAAWGGTKYCPPEVGYALRWCLVILVALCVLAFIILELIVITGSRTEIREEPDVVVILGAQIKSHGPSILLQDRLDTAFQYLEEHPDLPVVVTGGQGPDEPTTEAEAMRDYLVGRGLDAERIWLEDQAHNTNENLRYTGALLIEKGLNLEETHLLVVSNGFHLTRVRMLAGRNGLDVSTLSAPTSHPIYGLQSYIREAPALVKSWLLDRRT